MQAEYRTMFECGGKIITPKPINMPYVEHPGTYVVLPLAGGDRGEQVLYVITKITWTINATFHYVLSLEAVEGDPPAWMRQVRWK